VTTSAADLALRTTRATRALLARARSRRGAALNCADVTTDLPAILDDGRPASAQLVAHVETCLACQAELARYRRLVRLLHQMRAAEVEPPPGVVSEVLEAIERAAERRMIRSVLTGRTMAYAGAVLAAGLAAVALVAMARTRGRPVLPAGAGAIVMVPGMLGAQPRGGQERPRRGQ
jgi:anti-sigma factor RsiW